jgi:hypothetical protein
MRSVLVDSVPLQPPPPQKKCICIALIISYSKKGWNVYIIGNLDIVVNSNCSYKLMFIVYFCYLQLFCCLFVYSLFVNEGLSRYRARGWMAGVQFPAESSYFSAVFRPALRTTQHPVQGAGAAVFRWAKLPESGGHSCYDSRSSGWHFPSRFVAMFSLIHILVYYGIFTTAFVV